MDVFWTPLAIKDLEGIREFVQRDKPLAAVSLVAGIFRTVESLSTMPQRGRLSRLGTRELIIGSYIVRYRVTQNHVEVLRIRHGAQHWI